MNGKNSQVHGMEIYFVKMAILPKLYFRVNATPSKSELQILQKLTS